MRRPWGYVPAQYNLGDLYANFDDYGSCTEGESFKKDPANAAVWFEKAAAQGYPPAQDKLGDLYYKGEGVAKDPAKAAVWWEKAADQGNADSQISLGDLYYKGEGVEKNPAKAAVWWEKAADQGYHFEDQFSLLGGLYLRGEGGVAKDLKSGTFWVLKSGDDETLRHLLYDFFPVVASASASAPIDSDQQESELRQKTEQFEDQFRSQLCDPLIHKVDFLESYKDSPDLLGSLEEEKQEALGPTSKPVMLELERDLRQGITLDLDVFPELKKIADGLTAGVRTLEKLLSYDLFNRKALFTNAGQFFHRITLFSQTFYVSLETSKFNDFMDNHLKPFKEAIEGYEAHCQKQKTELSGIFEGYELKSRQLMMELKAAFLAGNSSAAAVGENPVASKIEQEIKDLKATKEATKVGLERQLETYSQKITQIEAMKSRFLELLKIKSNLFAKRYTELSSYVQS